jgi:tetratricopeptide (TPR) repeat protein
VVQKQEIIQEEFQQEETPEHIPDPNSVRVEIQRTNVKIDQDRLDQEAERRYEKARESFTNGKYWEASHFCEQALALHEDGRYYWLMGLAYSKHPRFRHKAEDSFHRAIKLDPVNDELHSDLAEFYVTQGLYMRARSHCQKALEIIPDQVRAKALLSEPGFERLGPGGCCCEHDPGCNHEEHKAWRLPKKT